MTQRRPSVVFFLQSIPFESHDDFPGGLRDFGDLGFRDGFVTSGGLIDPTVRSNPQEQFPLRCAYWTRNQNFKNRYGKLINCKPWSCFRKQANIQLLTWKTCSSVPFAFGGSQSEKIVPLQPNRLENLTAVYLQALQTIIDNPINFSGMVQAVYVNFGRLGIYEIRPQADFIKDSTPIAFEKMLGELFQNGRILKTGTTEEIMLRVPDIRTVIASFQENYLKIGCLSGACTQDGTDLQDYLTVASNDQSYLFVVGNFANKEIEQHIQDYVKVSQWDLNANAELRVVVNALSAKWGVL